MSIVIITKGTIGCKKTFSGWAFIFKQDKNHNVNEINKQKSALKEGKNNNNK